MHQPFLALVLDMDGVLVDSEPLHFKACQRMLSLHGVTLLWDVYAEYIGTTVEKTCAGFMTKYRLPGTLQDYIRQYDELVRVVLRNEVTPLPGVVQLLDEAAKRKLPVALASSSLKEWVTATLLGLHLSHAFKVVVSGEMVKRGKPEPDIYLLAASQLGVRPEHCVAVEDSPAGVRAAQRAGLYTIAVRTDYVSPPAIAEAERVIDSLEAFDWSLFSATP